MTKLRSARVAFSLAALFVLVTSSGLDAASPKPESVFASLPQVWRDDSGQVFDLSALRGRLVVLTMAYASCHRVCPMTMQRLQVLQRSFDARRIAAEFVIVGYDPEADDSAAWRRYRRNRRLMRPNWHFLVGSPQQVRRFARILGFDFWKADEHVMHEARIVYLDARGVVLTSPDAEDLVAGTNE
jgi:cytochrome oxidase Cu insertion factor (SCO1/SenC/PrrC family)